MDEYTEPDEPSISLIAKWFDEGRTCAECGTIFTEANVEAHKQVARQRRARA